MMPLHQRGTFSMCTAVLLVTLVAGSVAGWSLFGYIGIGPDVDAIIKGLTSGSTQVHLFSANNRNQNVTVIVGPAGATIDLDATYVFEQDISTLDGNFKGIKLMTPKKIKDRWPALTAPYVKMVGISDSKSDYVILVKKNDVSVLNTDSGAIRPLSSILVEDLHNATLLSSSKAGTFYYLDTKSQFMQVTFPSFPPANRFNQNTGPYICSSEEEDKARMTPKPCTPPVTWIKTGLTYGHFFALFDQNNSVTYFPKSFYYAQTGKPFYVRKTDAAHFWTKFKPSTTPLPSKHHSSLDVDDNKPLELTWWQNIAIVLGTLIVVHLMTICFGKIQARVLNTVRRGRIQ